MDELRDIKDIVEVNEYSLEILLLLISLTILLIMLSTYLYKNRKKVRKKPTKREVAKESLKSIDYRDIKDSVYRFSQDGALFIDDKNRALFQEIEEELQKYKYKKDVPALDRDLIEKMQIFIKEID